jgi:hypothetical protein
MFIDDLLIKWPVLTQDRLRKLIRYDPKTGLCYWLSFSSKRAGIKYLKDNGVYDDIASQTSLGEIYKTPINGE